jgi:lipopolysaccharide exporter
LNASFGTNVLKLLSSKIASQAITFVTAPIIARIFLPEHFGTVQLFSSISGVIIVISCLRYEFSIPLGKNKNEVIASFIISVTSTLVIALLSFVAVLILKGKVAVWLKSPELETFLWFLPLTVLLGGIGSSIGYYASRSGKFGVMAWADFGSVSGNILITISFGLIFGASAKFLFIGQITGMILSILILFIFLSREFLSEARTVNLSLRYIWEVAKQHKKFPIYDIWTGLFNTASMQLPPIILGVYFSTTVVGYYSLGNRFVGLPMALLGGAIAQVFFPSAAKEYNETGKLTNIVNNTFRRLVQIGVFPFMILGFFGGPLFGFVFGEKWIEAGVYTQILSIYVIFQFISSPLSTVFSIFNRQGTCLFLTLSQLINRTIALILLAQFGIARNCLIAYSVVSLVFYILIFYFVYRFSKASIGLGIKVLVKYAILSFILLLPVLFVAKAMDNIYFMLIALVVDLMLYLFILYRIDLDIRGAIHKISGKILLGKSL